MPDCALELRRHSPQDISRSHCRQSQRGAADREAGIGASSEGAMRFKRSRSAEAMPGDDAAAAALHAEFTDFMPASRRVATVRCFRNKGARLKA